jgi:hypothetical protein
MHSYTSLKLLKQNNLKNMQNHSQKTCSLFGLNWKFIDIKFCYKKDLTCHHLVSSKLFISCQILIVEKTPSASAFLNMNELGILDTFTFGKDNQQTTSKSKVTEFIETRWPKKKHHQCMIYYFGQKIVN